MAQISVAEVLQDKFYDLKADVINLKNSINVYAEVPGMELNDLNITLIGNFLIIQGAKRKHLHNVVPEQFIDNECPYGHFKKYIALPGKINKEKLEMNLDKGILNITINKV